MIFLNQKLIFLNQTKREIFVNLNFKRVFMLKIIQSLCKITILSLPFGVMNTGMIALSHAMEDQTPGEETLPPILQKMNIAAEEKLNTNIMALFKEEKWQEIVNESWKVREQLKADIRKRIGLSDDTFHILGQAYLNTYHVEGIDTTAYRNQAIEFFSYCAGIFPKTIDPSPEGHALVWGWLGVFFATDKRPEAHVALTKALDLYPQLDEFFKAYIDGVLPLDTSASSESAQTSSSQTAPLEALDPIYHERAGVFFTNRQQWDKAILQYEEAAKSGPLTDPLSYIHWGIAYFHAGKHVSSLDKFALAFARIPNPSAIHCFTAAEPALELEDWEKAAEFFEIGFKIAKDQSEPITLFNYANAGLANLNIGNWAKASEYLNKALALVSTTTPPVSAEYVIRIKERARLAAEKM